MKNFGLFAIGALLLISCDTTPGGNKAILPVVHDDIMETASAEDVSAVVEDAVEEVGIATAATAKALGSIDLDGVSLKGYADGFESKMINFLKGDGYANAADDDALKSTWYDFDQIQFKHGSTTELEAGSENQLDNLLKILQAHPDVKIKVGAYTDKTGDEDVNMRVSQGRADFIKKWLTDKGVGNQITGAEGYGSEFAKVPETASEEERATDRRVSVRFAK